MNKMDERIKNKTSSFMRPRNNVVWYLMRREMGLVQMNETCRLAQSVLCDRKVLKPEFAEVPSGTRMVFIMAVSPNRRRLAAAHGDHTIRIYDLASGKEVQTCVGHPRTPWCLQFHPVHDHIIASGCLAGEVRVWDLHSGTSLLWPRARDATAASLTFHPYEPVLAVACAHDVTFWNWTDMSRMMTWRFSTDHAKVRWIRFSPQGNALYTGTANRSTDDNMDQPTVSHIGEEGVHNELTPVYSYIREEWSRLQSSLAGWMTYGVGPAPSVSYVVRDSSGNGANNGDSGNPGISANNGNSAAASGDNGATPRDGGAVNGDSSANSAEAGNSEQAAANPCIRVERFAATVLRRRGAAPAATVSRSSGAREPGVATLVVESRSRMPPSLDVVTREAPEEEEATRQQRRQQLFQQIQQRQLRQHEHQRQRHYYLGAVLRESVLQAAQARVLSTRAQQNAASGDSEGPDAATGNSEGPDAATGNSEGPPAPMSNSEGPPAPTGNSEVPPAPTSNPVRPLPPTARRRLSNFLEHPERLLAATGSPDFFLDAMGNPERRRTSTNNSERRRAAADNSERPPATTRSSECPLATQLRQALMYQQSMMENYDPQSGTQARVSQPRPVTVRMAPRRAASIAALARAAPSSGDPPASAPSARRHPKRLRARSAEVHQRPGASRAALLLLRQSRRRQAAAAARSSAEWSGARQAPKRPSAAPGGSSVPPKVARPLHKSAKLVSVDLAKDATPGPSSLEPNTAFLPHHDDLEAAMSLPLHAEPEADMSLPLRAEPEAAVSLLRSRLMGEQLANSSSGSQARSDTLLQHSISAHPLVSRDNALNRPRPVQVLPQGAVLPQQGDAREAPEAPPEEAASGDARWLNLETRQVAHRDYGVPILDQTVNMPRTLRRLINQTIAGLIFGRGDGAVASNILGVNYKIRRWDMRSTSDITVQIANNCVVKQCKIHNDSSVSLSPDGSLLAAFVPTQNMPEQNVLSVYSTLPANLGQCLYTKMLGPNAITVDFSPVGDMVLVGLASRRTVLSDGHFTIAQAYRLANAFAGEKSMELLRNVVYSTDDPPASSHPRPHVSINAAVWLPHPCVGFAFGTTSSEVFKVYPGVDANEDAALQLRSVGTQTAAAARSGDAFEN